MPRRKGADCVWGHSFDAANTYTDRTGRRYCRACRLARRRADYAAHYHSLWAPGERQRLLKRESGVLPGDALRQGGG